MTGNEWQDMTLGDFISLQRGHDLTASERQPGNVPVMGSAGIAGYHDAALARGPGVTIGRSGVGSMGVVSFSPVDYWPHNTVLYVTDFHGNDERFAYYFLQHLNLRRFDSGSAQSSLNRNYVYPIPIRVPRPPEQKAISRILGTLDDRIALNRRMNDTLEAMAWAIFKSWFVDYDPVRAKMDGRKPSLPEPIANIFPSSFQDSELGEIPKGWQVSTVYATTEVIYGAPFASARFNTDEIGKPLIRIRDLADESPEVFTTEEHPKGYLVNPGDIVVGMDGEFRAHLWGGAEGWLNQRVCVFKPKCGFSAPFVFHSIVGLLAEVEATETATTVIHLGKNDIDRFRIVVPAALPLKAFGRLAEPLFHRIVINKQSARALLTLRDALLPKLLSGEISTAQAEKALT
jgi:type I restriction enzyme S subunit